MFHHAHFSRSSAILPPGHWLLIQYMTSVNPLRLKMADMWLAATRKAPELVPVIIRAASAAAAEHEELAARVKGRIRMYAENWLQGRRWEDFEACGASSLPPAAGEDRARTDCREVRYRPTWGAGRKGRSARRAAHAGREASTPARNAGTGKV